MIHDARHQTKGGESTVELLPVSVDLGRIQDTEVGDTTAYFAARFFLETSTGIEGAKNADSACQPQTYIRGNSDQP